MILAVTGGKGGVGKSTVALNVAAELDATLVDADLAMADLPTSRGPDLHDLLAGRASAFEAVTETGDVRVGGPVLVDCPAGLSSDVGIPLVAASACLLVTRPCEAALTAALRVRELARALATPLSAVAVTLAPGVAVNADDVATTLGAPVTTIPHSPAVVTAQAAGRPVTRVDPDVPAARGYASLAEAVSSSESAV
jgi:septum site-determining protein MinD